MDASDYYWIFGILLVTALGGFIAHMKRDYFTRGMAICFFTNPWGVVALILSPKSKARAGDEKDVHSWPSLSWLALGGTILTVAAVVVARWLL